MPTAARKKTSTKPKPKRTPLTPLQREIAALGPWFHNLHLPDGTQTCPDHWLGDFPSFKWDQLAPHLPQDLGGWTCLDIGCNAGFYTFQLVRRGARVVGLDLDERYLKQARWAAKQFGVERKVTFERAQVYDLAHDARRFDLVLFMGVFYHLRYPLLALDLVAEKVKRMMVFQTLTMPGDAVERDTSGIDFPDRKRMLAPGWPKMAFFEHGFAGDPTNWFAPNHAAVEAMLRSSGMKVTGTPGHEIYLCEPDPDNRPSTSTWNVAEIRAATGRGWK